jgi:hypothetical protein
VTGLTFKAALNHLAVCTHNSIILVFMVNILMDLHVIFSVKIKNFLPKAIAFGHMNGDTRDVLVFGMHDSRM